VRVSALFWRRFLVCATVAFSQTESRTRRSHAERRGGSLSAMRDCAVNTAYTRFGHVDELQAYESRGNAAV